jgi:tetratricopeptide repeat protein 8
MASLAFKVALGLHPDHPEALNNVAVMEARQGKVESAINYAEKSYREAANFEAAYNLSLWYLQTNQLEKANQYNKLALGMFPEHAESRALGSRLLRKLEAL